MALSVAGWVGIALLVFALALAAVYFLKYYYRRHQNNQKINANNKAYTATEAFTESDISELVSERDKKA